MGKRTGKRPMNFNLCIKLWIWLDPVGSTGILQDLIGSKGNWRDLAGSGGIWRDLAGSGGSWRDLAGALGIWWYLMGSGGIWRDLAGPGGTWRDLAGFGGLLVGSEVSGVVRMWNCDLAVKSWRSSKKFYFPYCLLKHTEKKLIFIIY